MNHRNPIILPAICLFLSLAAPVGSQTIEPTELVATPKIAEVLAAKLSQTENMAGVPVENRRLAYVKLLEGQRYILSISGRRRRSRASDAENAAKARSAFIAAVQLNPKLAEGYTALAEIALSISPVDVDEALALAGLAVKLRPDNLAARRIIAQILTFRSGLSDGQTDKIFGAKAIAAWSEITRLDSRNAEAWAFLGEFYERAGKTDDQIAALRSWLASAPPFDDRFFRRIMGGRETLSPQAASLKLGPALLKAGRTSEAIDVLSSAAADNADDAKSIDLLRGAVESLNGAAAGVAAASIKQAVVSNPGNVPLIEILAEAQSRSGDTDGAIRLLSESAAGVGDRESASALNLVLGDIYTRADRSDEALAAYERALSIRNISEVRPLNGDEREFAMEVIDKMLQTLKAANRRAAVRAVIERSRRLLGKDDSFADRQLIAYYRESGKKQEALDAVRKVRMRLPGDYGFIRLEATLLTEMGRVDDGVAVIKRLMKEKSGALSPAGAKISTTATADEFSNFLFISNLYSQANRGREASEAADQAYAAARGIELKQIARLTLATAQKMSGDYAAAEQTLRGILAESPGNPIAMNNLGYFLIERRERLDEAFGLIERAYRVDPSNPSYLDSLGWAYFALGKISEAERYLKEAARLGSGSSTIQEHLGDVYEKQGKTDFARSAWTKALQLASDPADVSRLKMKLNKR